MISIIWHCSDAVISLEFCLSGMNPLSPAIMEVSNSKANKYMNWPLVYQAPGSDAVVVPPQALEKASQSSKLSIETVPERLLAVAIFDDASTEAAVRANGEKLREAMERDGLVAQEPEGASFLTFAQYDAVYSMGKRRGEVWITLKDSGNPWQ